MQTIDSKTKNLSLPEILVQSIAGSGLKGVDLAKQLAMTMEEVRMKNTEAIKIRNTVFLTHLTPDRRTAYLKLYNIDTYKNFLGNLEAFLKNAKARGTDLFVYPYNDNSAEAVFNFLQKNSIALVETRKNKYGEMMALIMMDPKLAEDFKK